MWFFNKKNEPSEEEGLVFAIEGKPRKERGKTHRSRIEVFINHVRIELDGTQDDIACDDIYHVYIQEPLTEEVDSRTTVIKYYEEGEETYYELEDSTFDGLAEKMEQVLSREWSRFSEKKKVSDTVRWFMACSAPYHISFGEDPDLFGGQFSTPEVAAEIRKALYDSWEINNPDQLLSMLSSLFDGRAQAEYQEELNDMERNGKMMDRDDDRVQLILRIKETCGNKGIWAWDLCRLVLLCELGFIAGYLSYEKTMDWCFQAATKMQRLYASWDDMMGSYLLGYCFWSGDDLEDEDSEAYCRAYIYEELKKSGKSPYKLNWKLLLRAE